jgi:hypothetical protein
MSKPALGFLVDDIRRQREIAEDALKRAKEFDDMLANPNLSPEQKSALEKAKDGFLYVARELAANTTSTTSSAAFIVKK